MIWDLNWVHIQLVEIVQLNLTVTRDRNYFVN